MVHLRLPNYQAFLFHQYRRSQIRAYISNVMILETFLMKKYTKTLVVHVGGKLRSEKKEAI